ncbi:MAG: hypothetical protein V4677_15105 [Bacteroidota bacterium]
MKKYIYPIVLIFVCSTLFSQSTGYMGKRFVLGYGLNVSPAVFGATANNRTLIGNNGSAETGVLAFNAIHEGFLEFAASSKWMISFSTRYYKTNYDNGRLIDNFNNTNNFSIIDDKPNGYYTLRGLTYTLYFKYFGSRYVAPWGRYVMFGPTLNTVKTTYDPSVMNMTARSYDEFYNFRKDTLFSSFGPKEQEFKGFNLMFGFGRTRIIANRITLDYGCNIHFFSVLSAMSDLVFDGPVYSTEAVNSQNYIESTVKSRVRGINRFNVFLKVGVLLF